MSIVVAVVAHELAHVALGHELIVTPEQDAAQEAAVFERICEWGFRKEAVRLRAAHRWRDSRERTICDKPIRRGHRTAPRKRRRATAHVAAGALPRSKANA